MTNNQIIVILFILILVLLFINWVRMAEQESKRIYKQYEALKEKCRKAYTEEALEVCNQELYRLSHRLAPYDYGLLKGYLFGKYRMLHPEDYE